MFILSIVVAVLLLLTSGVSYIIAQVALISDAHKTNLTEPRWYWFWYRMYRYSFLAFICVVVYIFGKWGI